MHYGRTSFSKNKLPTIRIISDPNKPIGQRHNLSQTDIVQINALYDCSGNFKFLARESKHGDPSLNPTQTPTLAPTSTLTLAPTLTVVKYGGN